MVSCRVEFWWFGWKKKAQYSEEMEDKARGMTWTSRSDVDRSCQILRAHVGLLPQSTLEEIMGNDRRAYVHTDEGRDEREGAWMEELLTMAYFFFRPINFP